MEFVRQGICILRFPSEENILSARVSGCLKRQWLAYSCSFDVARGCLQELAKEVQRERSQHEGRGDQRAPREALPLSGMPGTSLEALPHSGKPGTSLEALPRNGKPGVSVAALHLGIGADRLLQLPTLCLPRHA